MKRFKLIAYLLIGLSSVALIATGFTFAWLSGATTEVNVENLQGGVISQYFHCGDGSENDPFVITRPVHLYNMTELYENLDGFAEENYHFQLGYDLENNGNLEFYSYDNDGKIVENSYSSSLNMNYYDGLKPIGSEEDPFGGTFDGSGLTIDKLNISGDGVSDIGMFGYVTEDAEIKDLYIDNLTVDITGAVANAHDAHDTNAHVGYIAGHIDDATCFTNTYVNNCEIIGHSVLTKNDWGYFGRCDNAATLEQFINKANGQGSGDDWGGSINMRSLNNRIWNLLNAPNNVRTDDPSVNHPTIPTTRATDVALQPAGKTYAGYTDYHRYYYDDNNYVSVENAVGEKNYNNRNPETTSNIYRLAGDGTYTNYTKDDTRYKKIVVPGTALPLTVGEKEDGYSVASRNTGYIVSGMAGGTGSYTGQTTIRVASSPIGSHIGNSLSSAGRSSTAYTSSQLEVITTNNPGSYSASNFSRIADEYNANNTSIASAMSSKYSSRGVQSTDLAKYTNAREQLDEILTGQSFSHGLHFTGSSISTSTTFTMPSATINGTTYSNYILPKNSIDFNLKEAGYINFFAGSYQHNTETTCDSFFSLHVVRRNGSSGISSISEISKVYDNTNAATKAEFPYVYEFTNGGNYAGIKNGAEVAYTKGSTVIFDMQYLWNAPGVDHALYYFEVPVNGGEFAMGSHSGKDKGTYLLYLDLSAHGGSEEQIEVDDFESIEYRSTPNTTEHSILLITYMQQVSQEVNLKVVYIEQDKRYNITYSGTLTEIIVTVLNTEYYVYFNGNLLPQVIQSNYL